MSTTSYIICPITGLSVSIQDNLGIPSLYPINHPVVKNPSKLYDKIKSGKASPTIIGAGILLRLHENELFIHPEKETPYLRGKILGLLEQETRFELTKLWWEIFNSPAPLKANPIKLDLAANVMQTTSQLIQTLWVIATQKLETSDTEYNHYRTTASWWQKEQKKAKRKGKVKIRHEIQLRHSYKQDPISAQKRVANDLTKICNATPTDYSLYWVRHIRNDLLPNYHVLATPIRLQLAKDLSTIYQTALEYEILHIDDVMAKSFVIVINLVERIDLTPIEVEATEEW